MRACNLFLTGSANTSMIGSSLALFDYSTKNRTKQNGANETDRQTGSPPYSRRR